MNTDKGMHAIYLESGRRKVLAGAIHWPGWCRFSRDEARAIQALLDAAPRYSQILKGINFGFLPPQEESDLSVAERSEGNATTDFGAPAMAVSADSEPVEEDDQARLAMLLNACWEAFDQAVEAAAGRELRLGPRGGGRDLEGIIAHVIAADESYLKRIGWRLENGTSGVPRAQLEHMRDEILRGFAAACRGETPTEGPRGGKRWSPRYFVRRVAYHVVDHAWEIEDRLD
jgi:hypothetical protein